MISPQVYDDDYFASMRKAAHDGRAEDFPVHRRFFEALRDRPLEKLRVLDVGCGRGELLVLLRKAKAREVYGLDFSPSAVRASQRLLTDTFGPGYDGDVRQATVADPSLFAPGSLDLVFMADVVEHLPQPVLEQALCNVRHWLGESGQLLIHTFPTLGPHRLFQLYARLARPRRDLEALNSIHCNVQTRRRLRRTLQQAGFECERMWLENDIVATSNWYLMMSPASRRMTRALVDGFLRLRAVDALIGVTGLAEWAKPSIYCVCTKGAGAVEPV